MKYTNLNQNGTEGVLFPKMRLFYFKTGIGGNVVNGNGRMWRHVLIYLLRKRYYFKLWEWKVGNGEIQTYSSSVQSLSKQSSL